MIIDYELEHNILDLKLNIEISCVDITMNKTNKMPITMYFWVKICAIKH